MIIWLKPQTCKLRNDDHWHILTQTSGPRSVLVELLPTFSGSRNIWVEWSMIKCPFGFFKHKHNQNHNLLELIFYQHSSNAIKCLLLTHGGHQFSTMWCKLFLVPCSHFACEQIIYPGIINHCVCCVKQNKDNPSKIKITQAKRRGLSNNIETNNT